MLTPDYILTIPKKESRNLDLFWLGLIIYTVGVAFSVTGHIDIKLCQVFQVPGLLIMVPTMVRAVRFKFANGYLRFFFTLYIGWLMLIVVRGMGLLANYSFLKEFLFDPYRGLIYFAPFIMLFPLNLVYLKKLFNVVFIFGVVYLGFNILFIKDLIHADASPYSKAMVETFADLSFANGFILLTFAYHPKKNQILAIVDIVLTILMAVLHGRRGLLFMCSSISFTAYLLFLITSKNKALIIYATLFMVLAGGIYVNSIYKAKESKLFGFLLNRGSEDTRSDVEQYFYDDMKMNDWIVGRGIAGEYFCPDIEDNQVTNYRSTIETGYLQAILNGGLINVVLFLLICVPAIIKGLFYSKNILSKAAALWIFMSIINSYPTIDNNFTIKYLIVWVSVGICYSKELRNVSEEQLRGIFAQLP